MTSAFDYVLVGGGLQNALLALALRARRPGSRVALVERAASLGGNHTWSFHEGDVPEAAREWVEPLVARRWPSYDVRFPGLERTLRHAYATIPSARVDAVVRERLSLRGAALGMVVQLRLQRVHQSRQGRDGVG